MDVDVCVPESETVYEENESTVISDDVGVKEQRNFRNSRMIEKEENMDIEYINEKWKSLTIEQKEQAIILQENFKSQAKLDSTPSRFEEVKARYIPFPENKKLTVDNIQAHLKDQLGNDLKKYDAQEDNIYLDELRKIEPRTEQMCQKLKREHYKDKSSLLMRDIVPKKSERITKRLKEFVVTDKTTSKEYQYINSVKQGRRESTNNLPISEVA